MQEQFKDEPALSSAILGAVLLSMAHGIATGLFYWLTTDPNMARIDGNAAAIVASVVAGTFWGWWLGACVGRAWGLFKRGKLYDARKILVRSGAWSTAIHLVWFAFVFISLLQLRLWTHALLQMLMNLCFQWSLLTLLVGLFLPRREEETVQITEKLRL